MSRFVDKLNSVTRAAPPLGFQARKAAGTQPKLLLVASLGKSDFGSLTAGLAGADAAFLESPDSSDIKEAVKKSPELPWGVAGSGEPAGEADFVVLAADSPAGENAGKDGVGRVLEIGDILDEGWLRAVSRLPVDAALIGSQAGAESLTWRRLMQIQYCADLLSKPLLVTVPADVSKSQLEAIGKTGVVGVVVPVTAGMPEDRLAELRKVIDNLDLTVPRRKDKAMALLPHIGGGSEAEIEEPGEPEDPEDY